MTKRGNLKRRSVFVDEAALKRAKRLLRAPSDSETIRLSLERVAESVAGLSDARGMLGQSDDRRKATSLPLQVQLAIGGTTHYRVFGGVLRTLTDSTRLLGDRSPAFASVSLLNRYYSELAELTLRGLGDAAMNAFASATDLGTGLERPEPLAPGTEAGELHVRATNCPPRTLLRIYWRLDRS